VGQISISKWSDPLQLSRFWGSLQSGPFYSIEITENGERFERELARLAKLPYRALAIEAGWPECASASHRYSQLKSEHVIGSTMGWWLKLGVPSIFAGDRDHAARTVLTLLRLAAKYHLQGTEEMPHVLP
jgi:hypothetical protein